MTEEKRTYVLYILPDTLAYKAELTEKEVKLINEVLSCVDEACGNELDYPVLVDETSL